MNPAVPGMGRLPVGVRSEPFPAMLVDFAMSGLVRPMTPVPVGRFFVRHQIELIGSIDDLADLATAGVRQVKGRPS